MEGESDMKLVQCSNGHYYDSSKFSASPYCSDKMNGPGYTMPLNQQAAQAAAPQTAAPQASPAAEAPVPEMDAEASASPISQESPVQPISEQWRPQMNQAGFWQVGEDDNKTVSYYSRTIGTEPVVGYLIAIEGAYFGEGFKLKTGRNFIGRSPEMDIQLSQDFSVSRRKHAVVIYEPKSRMFIAQPGESRELVYINDEVVLNNVVMKPYDILTIGETRLLLLPLCGEKFSWDDLKKEEK